METHNFRELKVWQSARTLVKDVYVLIACFPEDERFGLTSQVRRAAVSVPSNIAEGSGRSDRDFVRFLSISLSSAYEVETQLLLAYDLGFLSQEKLDLAVPKVHEIQRMIVGLQRKLSKGFLSVFFLPFPLWTKLYYRTSFF